MEKRALTFKRIGPEEKPAIKELFLSVFTVAPWNDDWSDDCQLEAYLNELVGQGSSLTYGLYDKDRLIGVAMGHIKHWFSGTEYCLEEFCIAPDKQGNGFGTHFMELIGKHLKEGGIKYVFCSTERDVPAYPFYKRNGFDELPHHVTFVKRFR